MLRCMPESGGVMPLSDFEAISWNHRMKKNQGHHKSKKITA